MIEKATAAAITVRFFASLREQLGTEQIRIPSDGIATVASLREVLAGRDAAWQKAFEDRRVLAAVNQSMAKPSTPVKAGDEVAFFPPVTGG